MKNQFNFNFNDVLKRIQNDFRFRISDVYENLIFWSENHWCIDNNESVNTKPGKVLIKWNSFYSHSFYSHQQTGTLLFVRCFYSILNRQYFQCLRYCNNCTSLITSLPPSFSSYPPTRSVKKNKKIKQRTIFIVELKKKNSEQ